MVTIDNGRAVLSSAGVLGRQRSRLTIFGRLLVLIVLVTTGLAAFDLIPAEASVRRTAATEKYDFPFAGPRAAPMLDGTGRYVVYGAGPGVPVAISGRNRILRTNARIRRHALPVLGAWARPHAGVWTPQPFYRKTGRTSRYYLFYTAPVRGPGTSKRCIGVATSSSAISGFVAARRALICPDHSIRWDTDADVVTGPNGRVWITWRDGQHATRGESALSVARLRFGRRGRVALASPPRVLLRSNRLLWAHYRRGGRLAVIESPNLLWYRGGWYLVYSGNAWPTNYESIGIAYCGARLTDGGCQPLPGHRRAYFSYTGPRRHLPARLRTHGLAGNKRGPGEVDVFRTRDGSYWLLWDYLTGRTGQIRKSRVGRLVITGKGARARFQVRLAI